MISRLQEGFCRQRWTMPLVLRKMFNQPSATRNLCMLRDGLWVGRKQKQLLKLLMMDSFSIVGGVTFGAPGLPGFPGPTGGGKSY